MPPFSCCLTDFGRAAPTHANYLVANQHLDAAQVVGQIHQRHPYTGAGDTDGAHEDATHAVLHVPKDMLHPSAYAGLGFVADFLILAQWLAPVRTLNDLADVFAVFEALLLIF